MFEIGKVRTLLGDPGQLYNMGNALVLLGGIGGAVFAALGDGADLGGAGGRIVQHFFGSPPALALTAATLVFIVGGAAYSRAWRGDGPLPDARLNRFGDVLSGIGAVVLGIGLVMLGDAMLATFAGAVHATGKFGSAFAGARRVGTARRGVLLADICKDAVLCSRFPALLAAFSGLLAAMEGLGTIGPIVLSLSVAVSTVYWAIADILLLRRDGPLLTTLRRVFRGRPHRSATTD